MNLDLVDKLARALLYEGYILYPYRASAVKNQQRFNFGGVYPPAYSQAQAGMDACLMQTECLVEPTDATELEVCVRFLHLRSREIGRLNGPWHASDSHEKGSAAQLACEVVESLQIDGRSYHSWQEAVERQVILPCQNLDQLTKSAYRHEFRFATSEETEPLRDANRQVVAVAVRRQQPIFGSVEVSAEVVQPSLCRVRVVVKNETPLADVSATSRDDVLLRTLVSTHTVLGVSGGEFVSLLDTPDEYRAAVAQCTNLGTWPVLVGQEGERETLLSSPIILYDYPQLAPESAGELFDGTEIDEILTLRIMTLTEDEKREMRGIDDRAREILERTEQMPPEQLLKMHGVMRNLRAAERTSP